MDEMIEAIDRFMSKQEEAEQRGERYFLCPLCGGEAHWHRLFGHLHCGCRGCGIRIK